MKNLFKSLFKVESLFLIILLSIAALAHGYNMFHLPYYENDEGVYMAQAWSLIKFGQLAPYTYWYDHAPGGWIFIALWTVLTGGFFTFDFSLNTGRVFMLVLHVFSAFFLYFITKRLTDSKLAGWISVLIFSLSPLAVYFQRRILLDNIMIFWILMSYYYILHYKNKLRNIITSALAFGIALLSKETAIFLTPIYLYTIYHYADYRHKSFALVKWVSIVGLVVAFYFIYALLKGEFFPSGTLLGGTEPHVSLIEALKFQASRGGGSILDPENSSFWTNMRIWIEDDPTIIYMGIGTTILNLLIGIKRFPNRVAGLLSGALLFYLLRGGLVIEFYILPLIPLFALNIAVFASSITALIRSWSHRTSIKVISYIPMILVAIGVTASSIYYSTNIRQFLNLYTSDQTTPQLQAVEWILDQDIPNAFFVIDNYGYIDLQERKDPSIKTEWYWKVDRDPDVREKLLHNDPRNIDFIGVTPQMRNDVAYSGLGLTLAAWRQSSPIVSFTNDYWGVEFWGNSYPRRVLDSSWRYYKNQFIVDGQVIDPYQNNNSNSEGQSYAMLRAVWLNDRKTFDSVFTWTKSHLQQNTGLFSWKWDSQQKSIVDRGTAPDADTDIALALLFASKQWNDEKYLKEAKKIINGIWEHEVVIIRDRPYLSAGNWANGETVVTINPSYLSPATYRMFAEVDKEHDWIGLVDTSYIVLEQCTKAKLDKSKGVLPPEWCAINKRTAQIEQSKSPQPEGTAYSFNAFRVPWRIALDYQWYNSERAKKYISSLTFLSSEYKKTNKLMAAYEHDGKVFENYESVAAYAGDLGYFVVTDPKAAKKIYEEKIYKKFYEGEEKSYWDDPQNYYTQNWAWFGTALYSNLLPNLWEKYR